jgi:hypothetical protein
VLLCHSRGGRRRCLPAAWDELYGGPAHNDDDNDHIVRQSAAWRIRPPPLGHDIVAGDRDHDATGDGSWADAGERSTSSAGSLIVAQRSFRNRVGTLAMAGGCAYFYDLGLRALG